MPGQISPAELFAALTMFMLGSAWLVNPGASAGQDAWLAALGGAVFGLIPVLIHLRLQSLYPGRTLIQYLPELAGRIPGKFLGLCYILYFLFLAALVTRDFVELTLLTLLPSTPQTVVVISTTLLTCYAMRHGQEGLARCAQVLLLASALTLAITFGFALSTFHPEYLQPVLGDGSRKVWQAIFPVTMTFPFGETIVFGMVWHLVNRQRTPSTLGAVALAGTILTILAALETGILGPHLVETSLCPLLEMVKEIDVSYLFNRLDPVASLLLSQGGFIKASISACAAAQGLSQWLDLKDYRQLVLPLGALVASLTMALGRSHQEHLYIGMKVVPYYLHVPLQIVVPGALLLLAEAKQRAWRRNRSAQASQGDRTW